jgi:alkanesulfonate monooxygenase SsuD/methylene tetrahydromethanopterin reductase-like flavin-dependent oxidoreductase (luciferase family)
VKVSVHLNFQNWRSTMTDEEMYRGELALAEKAEEQGYYSIWAVEHHFDSYSMCPNPGYVLSWLAARTSTIKLATGAFILPWNDPLRIAEQVILLDNMSNGRLLVGFGRGLAKREYEGFRIDMNESRDRFDESAAMIIAALEKGVMEYDGQYYKQPRVELRPQPSRSFTDRIYSVAMSPDSQLAAGDIGATMMTFVQHDIEEHAAGINAWRDRFREVTGREPAPPVLTDHTFCDEDPAKAEDMARKYCEAYYASVITHYNMDEDHFAETKGYSAYAESAKMIQEKGLEGAAKEFADHQIWGTPDQIIEKYKHRVEVLGSMDANIIFSYGCMSFEEADSSQRLFAEKVLPELKKL